MPNIYVSIVNRRREIICVESEGKKGEEKMAEVRVKGGKMMVERKERGRGQIKGKEGRSHLEVHISIGKNISTIEFSTK